MNIQRLTGALALACVVWLGTSDIAEAARGGHGSGQSRGMHGSRSHRRSQRHDHRNYRGYRKGNRWLDYGSGVDTTADYTSAEDVLDDGVVVAADEDATADAAGVSDSTYGKRSYVSRRPIGHRHPFASHGHSSRHSGRRR